MDTVVKVCAALALLSVAWLALVSSLWVLVKAVKAHWPDLVESQPTDLSKLVPPDARAGGVRQKESRFWIRSTAKSP